MFIIILFSLGCDRPAGLFFLSRFCFFPYSRLSSYLLRQFLCLISFLLFPCASVWENTRGCSPCPVAILNGTFLFSRGEIVCLGRSFVYQNQIKLNLIKSGDFFYFVPTLILYICSLSALILLFLCLCRIFILSILKYYY